MQGFSPAADNRVLVDMSTSDDAGVFRLRDDLAVVQSVDYITPIVDDPDLYGQIAAANSLSDIYAMGATPVTVLNLCNFPSDKVEISTLRKILAGGYRKVREAGAHLLGGHSIRDPELKYGLSVTGVVHPDKILRNSTARAGDVLILTKPIGTGVITQAARQDRPVEKGLEEAIRSMAALNRAAGEAAASEPGVHACTDVTGFGLAGHALEMAAGSGVEMVLDLKRIPLFTGVLEQIGEGVRTGNTESNREATASRLKQGGTPPPEHVEVMYDPQTSGGLLIAVAADRAEAMLRALHAGGAGPARIIGRIVAGPGGIVLDWSESR